MKKTLSLLAFNDIRRPELLNNIVKALAFQIGNEVSYNELAQTVQSDNKTVERYIDLLEKCYVVFRLDPFSRNRLQRLIKWKRRTRLPQKTIWNICCNKSRRL